MAAAVAAAMVALAAGCGSSSPPRTSTVRSAAATDPPTQPQSGVAGRPAGSGPAAARTGPAPARDGFTAAGKAAGGTATPSGTKAPKRRRAIPPAHPVPAAFRPAPGAPSDAEVRAELAQLDAIQRTERERALIPAPASLAGLLPWADEPKSGIQVSVASVFRDYGLGLACGGVLGRDQLGVAHKTAPCGTPITFTYAGRSLTVPVIDRGPYVAGREWDLTGATAEALGFPGLGQIEWSVAGEPTG
jgi:Lytic transglycolase